MSYQPGQRPWVVYNPWVFADYGQPQRRRGYVSPVAFQTHTPSLGEGEGGAIGAIGGVIAIGFLIYIGAKELRAGPLSPNKVRKHVCRCVPPKRRRRRR